MKAITWFTVPSADATYQRDIRGHLREALRCLTALAS